MNLSQIEYPDEAEDCRLCYRDVAARLAMAAKRPGTSKSKIVNDALDRFLNPARDQHLVATIVEGQRDLSQEVRHLDRDLDIVAETLALWLRYFLTVTPPLPAGDQEPARLIGRQRFDVFIREIARRKPSDKRYLTRIVKLAAKEGSGPPLAGYHRARHQKANPTRRPMVRREGRTTPQRTVAEDRGHRAAPDPAATWA